MSIKCCKNCDDRWLDEENGNRCHDKCLRYNEEHDKTIKQTEVKQEYFRSSYFSKKVLKGMGRR